MFVIDFAPHLPKKTLPARNVRISPDSGTLAATFGEERRAEHAAWWSTSDGNLIGTSSILSSDLEREDDLVFIEPVFVPDLSCCAVHGTVLNEDDTQFFHLVVLVTPGVSYARGIALYPNWSVTDCDIDVIAVTPDSRYVLAGYGLATLCKWDLKKVKLDHPDNPRPADFIDREDVEHSCTVIRYDGDRIALGSDSARDEKSDAGYAFSGDGKLVARGLLDGSVQVYNWRSRKLKGTFGALSRPRVYSVVCGLAFSPNGTRLGRRAGGRVTVFDLKTGKPAVRLKPTDLTDMAFTPDGKRMLTGGSDKLVRVWDTTTWKEIARYDWKIGAIHSVTVSPDGLTAAAGGDNCRVVVWDVEG